jgi:hypothetical protein
MQNVVVSETRQMHALNARKARPAVPTFSPIFIRHSSFLLFYSNNYTSLGSRLVMTVIAGTDFLLLL